MLKAVGIPLGISALLHAAVKIYVIVGSVVRRSQIQLLGSAHIYGYADRRRDRKDIVLPARILAHVDGYRLYVLQLAGIVARLNPHRALKAFVFLDAELSDG